MFGTLCNIFVQMFCRECQYLTLVCVYLLTKHVFTFNLSLIKCCIPSPISLLNAHLKESYMCTCILNVHLKIQIHVFFPRCTFVIDKKALSALFVCFFLSFFLTHRTRMQKSRTHRRSVVRDASGQKRVCVEQIDDRSEPRDNLQHHLHHLIHHYCAQNDREEERVKAEEKSE